MTTSEDEGRVPVQEPGPGASPEEKLRYRAAEALERGWAFVERHGDELARLRARTLLGAEPVEVGLEAVEAVCALDAAPIPLGLARQGAAGLAQFAQADPIPEWLGALESLIFLSDLDALGAPVVARIAHSLTSLQAEDGGFGILSDSESERILATGLIAGHLARTRVVRPKVLSDASHFMSNAWAPSLVGGRAWPLVAAFGCWFSSVGNQDDLADGALQQVGRELERGFRQGTYDAAGTVRVLLHCDASAVPGAGLVPGELLEALLSEQGEDGGFAELTDGPDALRVMPTFDAMLGTIRLCGVI